MMPRSRVALLWLATVAVVMLAGCTAAAAPSAPTASPSATESAADVQGEPVVLDAGTVVGTGRLTSVDGRTTGDVSIVADGSGTFVTTISRFASPSTGEAMINLASKPFTEEAYCANGFMILADGPVVLATDMTWPNRFDDLILGNPDFLDTLILTSNDGAAPRTGCFYPVIATAALSWSMPDVRPDLVVVDSGSTGGATGSVLPVEGTPTSYTVAPGDVLKEIAARFGITVADLAYLNPNRAASTQGPGAQSGERINLDKKAR
jgi:hypothetical protein